MQLDIGISVPMLAVLLGHVKGIFSYLDYCHYFHWNLLIWPVSFLFRTCGFQFKLFLFFLFSPLLQRPYCRVIVDQEQLLFLSLTACSCPSYLCSLFFSLPHLRPRQAASFLLKVNVDGDIPWSQRQYSDFHELKYLCCLQGTAGTGCSSPHAGWEN